LRFAAPRRGALPATGPAGATEAKPGGAGPDASGVPASDILRICASLLVTGAVPSAPSTLSAPPASPHSPVPNPSVPDDLILFSIDPPESSGPGSLTFVGPKTPLRVRSVLRAGLILAEPGIDPVCAPPSPDGNPVAPVGAHGAGPSASAIVLVHSVPAALAAILTALADRLERTQPYVSGPGNRIAPTAVVEGCLEGDVTVGAGAYVGPGSFIGSGTRIEANAVIQEHCHIGRGCVIQSGAVIGCAGFGFFARRAAALAVPGPAVPGLEAMPHPAGVVIGDGCWIGANAVIAAGVLAPTRLGDGCKLDSHVQIAHNVRLGNGCLLASQSGIAGSTVAGDRLRMGGASSVDGHLRLGNDVSVAACSGVTKDVADGVTVAGFPARPIREWRRDLAQRKSP
jgi:UDP-3-O-[3-hydroxymyristoyl] glucosamine N-acyltransferase